MARIRTVKPGFFRSPDIRVLSLHARLTYIGLWTYVDDEGRGSYDVPVIRGDIWPDDDSETVLGSLQELSRRGLIRVYEHSGRTYFYVPEFLTHQRIDKPRPSELPGPDSDGSSLLTCENTDAGVVAEESRNAPGVVAEASRLEGKGKEEEGKGAALRADRPEVGRLCDLLADRIEANGSKRPTITKGWWDAARLMLDKDGRTEEQVSWLIDWCQRDDFWKANILSMPKMRDKFDQMRLQSMSGRSGGRPAPGPRDHISIESWR